MAKAGYNQSGGAYFICVTDLVGTNDDNLQATEVTPTSGIINSDRKSHLYKITIAGSKSGGAYVEPTLAPVSAIEVLGIPYPEENYEPVVDKAAAVFGPGKLIKDMGKTVISGGRTFRKFAVAETGAQFVKSLGVAGAPATAPGAGYATFYLDVGREGRTGTSIPAPIARYY